MCLSDHILLTSCMTQSLFIVSTVCVYTFFCIFLYGALCPRFCYGSYAVEMVIIIIKIIINISNSTKTRAW